MMECYEALTCASDMLLYLPILQRENNFGSHPFCEFQITNMISEEVFVTKSESATIKFLKSFFDGMSVSLRHTCSGSLGSFLTS